MSTKRWDTNGIPDQRGRVVIVTGSSSGLGLETAKALAAKHATTIVAVRNPEKGERALEQIHSSAPDADVRQMPLNLADLDSIAAFASAFLAEFDRLDLLINNAGVMIPPYGQTKDGFELQMGTNHMGHFALTGRLLELLAATAGSRIVNVASLAHHGGNIDFDDIDWTNRTYRAWQGYSDSKLANLYFTYELARKLDGTGPLVTAAHPGWSATELQRHAGLIDLLGSFFAQSGSMGALPTLYAAVHPDTQSGDYIGPRGPMEAWGYPRKVKSNRRSRDTAAARTLWEISEQRTGVSCAL